jgi:hypothetical protein
MSRVPWESERRRAGPKVPVFNAVLAFLASPSVAQTPGTGAARPRATGCTVARGKEFSRRVRYNGRLSLVWRRRLVSWVMIEEPEVKEEQAEPKPVEEQKNQAAAPNSQPQLSGRRLRELLAIPERERSDEIWDEIISLEIQLAPGNRAPTGQAAANGGGQPGNQPQAGRIGDQGQRRGPGPGMKSGKRFSNKSKRGPRRPAK